MRRAARHRQAAPAFVRALGAHGRRPTHCGRTPGKARPIRSRDRTVLLRRRILKDRRSRGSGQIGPPSAAMPSLPKYLWALNPNDEVGILPDVFVRRQRSRQDHSISRGTITTRHAFPLRGGEARRS